MKNVNWYAAISPGLEATLIRELEIEGYKGLKQHGGVEFEASLEQGARLVPELFSPNKIRVLLKKDRITGLGDINTIISSIKWKQILHPHTPIVVDVQTSSSRFFRKDIIRSKAERCFRAILGFPSPEKPTQTVFLYIQQSTLFLYLDAGGGLLHKRGWRREQSRAPLRETYASALLLASGWTPEEALFDPFCGSGTIAIEAARMAFGATAKCTPYPVQSWKGCHNIELRSGNPTPFSISGSDHHLPSIELAVQYAQQLNLNISWKHCDIKELELPKSGGLIVTNPPYGKRLGNNVRNVYRHFGRLIARSPQWRALFLCPSASLAKMVSKDAIKLTEFSNGGFTIGVWIIDPQ